MDDSYRSGYEDDDGPWDGDEEEEGFIELAEDQVSQG